MTEMEERRANICDPSAFMTHEQHREMCQRGREWSEAKVKDSERDRDSLHQAVEEINETLKSNKTWLIGTLITIIAICLGAIGYMSREGGYAKASDMMEVKTEIRVMKIGQENMAITMDEIRKDQLRRQKKELNGR